MVFGLKRKGTQMCSPYVIFLVLAYLDFVHPYSVSVPPVKSVCKTMHPGHHKYKQQTEESPYSVTPESNEVQGGGTVEVVLQGSGDKMFKGYYLQARDENDAPIGMFTPNTLAKVHSCGGIRGNAAHHANPEDKDRVTVSWRAPQSYKGDVTFTATFVENFVHFWVQVKAPNAVKVV